MTTIAELEARIAAVEQHLGLEPPAFTPDPRIVGRFPEIPDPIEFAEEARAIVTIDGDEVILKRVQGNWEPAFAYDIDLDARIRQRARGRARPGPQA